MGADPCAPRKANRAVRQADAGHPSADRQPDAGCSIQPPGKSLPSAPRSTDYAAMATDTRMSSGCVVMTRLSSKDSCEFPHAGALSHFGLAVPDRPVPEQLADIIDIADIADIDVAEVADTLFRLMDRWHRDIADRGIQLPRHDQAGISVGARRFATIFTVRYGVVVFRRKRVRGTRRE